ncbi:hypothetical protein H8959_004529, partial [Pygathrix nigripes]
EGSRQPRLLSLRYPSRVLLNSDTEHTRHSEGHPRIPSQKHMLRLNAGIQYTTQEKADSRSEGPCAQPTVKVAADEVRRERHFSLPG